MIQIRTKYLWLVIIFTSQLLFSQHKGSIYKKGWIDFNKNGTLDIYEDPKAPLEKECRI